MIRRRQETPRPTLRVNTSTNIHLSDYNKLQVSREHLFNYLVYLRDEIENFGCFVDEIVEKLQYPAPDLVTLTCRCLFRSYLRVGVMVGGHHTG